MPCVKTFHRAYGGYPLQRQGVCGDVGRDAVAFGDGDNAANPVLYPHDALGRAALVVALQLVSDVDEAAGVYDVVRGVEYAAFVQILAVGRLGEHIVGAPGDDAATHRRDGHVVEYGAEGARGEDVARDAQDLIGVDRFGAELPDYALQGRLVYVSHDQVRALLVQQPAQVVADVPDALHGDAQAREGGRAEALPDTGPHPLKAAEGGGGGGVPRAAAGDIDPDDV